MQDIFVNDAGRHLCDIDNVVGIPPKAFDHRPVDAFIREQVHADRALTG